MVKTRNTTFSHEEAQRACVSNTLAPTTPTPSWAEPGVAEHLTNAAADPALAANTEHAHPLNTTLERDESHDQDSTTRGEGPPASNKHVTCRDN